MSNLDFETDLWNKNYNYICGIDEVGRGCLAGPVYSGAVILDKNKSFEDPFFEKINDSKKVSTKVRENLVNYINEISISTAVGYCTAEEIDEIGIQNAVKLSMKRALNNLSIKPNYLLIDSLSIDSKIPQKNIIRGDQASKSISSASIISCLASFSKILLAICIAILNDSRVGSKLVKFFPSEISNKNFFCR